MLDLKLTFDVFNKRDFIPQNQSRNGWVKNKLLYINVEFEASNLEEFVSNYGEKQITQLSKTRYIAIMSFMDDTYSYNMLMGY